MPIRCLLTGHMVSASSLYGTSNAFNSSGVAGSSPSHFAQSRYANGAVRSCYRGPGCRGGTLSAALFSRMLNATSADPSVTPRFGGGALIHRITPRGLLPVVSLLTVKLFKELGNPVRTGSLRLGFHMSRSAHAILAMAVCRTARSSTGSTGSGPKVALQTK